MKLDVIILLNLLILERITEDGLKNVMKEIAIMKKLDHENIVRLH